jgi:hypothetical protein
LCFYQKGLNKTPGWYSFVVVIHMKRMETKTQDLSAGNNSEQHCRHPYLKEGPHGEKICAICGRTVYAGNTESNGSRQARD